MAEFPVYSDGADPRELLQGLMRGLQQLLDEIVQENTDPMNARIFPEAMIGDIRAAWEEARRSVEVVIQRIPPLSEGTLEDHWLRGAQLRFKLSAVRYIHQRFLGFGKRFLKKFLEILDAILESIAEITHAAGAIIEFKKILEQLIEDDD